MYYLYKLSIDLKEGLVILGNRIFPKFDLEWTWTLHYSFRKSNIQIPKSLLQSNFT